MSFPVISLSRVISSDDLLDLVGGNYCRTPTHYWGNRKDSKLSIDHS